MAHAGQSHDVVIWIATIVLGTALLAAGALVHALVRRLRQAAHHDPLTGLPNRARFAEWLDELLSEGSDEPVAVVFIDLDDFKRVNDSLGHAVGDALLLAVSARLRGRPGASTVVARFGGDEFVAAIRSREWEAAARRLQDVFSGRFAIGEYELTVRASLGIALARYGEDAQTVMSHADTAVYHAKREGRARAVVFDDSMRAAVAKRLRLEHDLRHALERDELEVAFQPIVALREGRSPAPRRWRAGRTPSSGRSRRTCSSAWPRTPA